MLFIKDRIPSQESIKDSQWVLENWEELQVNYGNQAVAIRDGRVIDSDQDFAELERRCKDAAIFTICEQTREGTQGEVARYSE